MEQLSEAVGVALQVGADPALKAEALNFLAVVRANSRDWWKPALEILQTNQAPAEAEVFAYQVLDSSLPQLSPIESEELRQGIWSKLQTAVGSAVMPPHLRTKLAETLCRLFVVLYGSSWPGFFRDLMALEGDLGADMYLRVLKIVHEEIGDNLFDRSPQEVQRNNVLKDQVRSSDMPLLVRSWITLLSNPSSSIVKMALEVVAGWVSWIDISLLLSEEEGALIPLIFKQFNIEETRAFAAQTVVEIVSKKMPPAHKLELVKLLDLEHLLNNLPTGDIEFDERMAKVVNAVALELTRILDEDSSQTDAEQQFIQTMPAILTLLGNEYDDTSVQVIPAVQAYVHFIRREAKRARAALDPSLPRNQLGQVLESPQVIPSPRRDILRAILEKAVLKSRLEPDDPEDDEFLELRARLKVLQQQIFAIDSESFTNFISQFVPTALKSQNWTETELALYELSVLADGIKTDLVKVPRGSVPPAQETLHQLFWLVLESNDLALEHPACQLLYMELVFRHAGLFNETNSQLLVKSLDFFVGTRGIHNPSERVRVRAWHLLFRLLKKTRKLLSSDLAPTIIQSSAPLLVIGIEDDGIFGAQLYLYELCGMLLASSTERETMLARDLLREMFSDLDRSVTSSEEGAPVRVHHIIMALGSFVRGMADADTPAVRQGPLGQEMKMAAAMVVAVLEQSYEISLVREACRFAFSRLVGLLGSSILVEISQLINSLLTHASPDDMVDLFNFLGQLCHQFNDDAQVFDMFCSLIPPLFDAVFSNLRTVADDTSGTDAQNNQKELVHSYLHFIHNILNNRYGGVLFPVFESVIQALFHYAAQGEAQNQRVAVLVLIRMTQLYADGRIPDTEFMAGQPVPLFSEFPIYARLTEFCWSLATNDTFKLTDAQTRLVALELGGLQKVLWDTKGQAYHEYLVGYLASAGLSGPLVQDFAEHVGSPSKDFKKYFYDFLVKAQ